MLQMNQPTTKEKKKRQKFPRVLYDQTLARFIIAKKMVMLGEVKQARNYLDNIDPQIYEYAVFLRGSSWRSSTLSQDPRPLKFLVKFVFNAIDIHYNKPQNGQHLDMDQRYYLNQLAKWNL